MQMLASIPGKIVSVFRGNTTMGDAIIRKALRKDLRRIHADRPGTLIIDELGLCQGCGRIDVAVVNNRLLGFEIKSDRDTMARLPSQRQLYNRIFDQVTLVSGKTHLDKVLQGVPAWWGITTAERIGKKVVFSEIRCPSDNPDKDVRSVVQLLWRDEALEILKERGAAWGVLSKSKRYIWDRLVDTVPEEDLCGIVRDRLKSRTNWR